jgi:hypothetical protein
VEMGRFLLWKLILSCFNVISQDDGNEEDWKRVGGRLLMIGGSKVPTE